MIVCCGEALVDMVPFRDGSGQEAFKPCPGGSPYNTAIAVGRLGVPCAFLGKLSSDFFGGKLVSRLRENGVSDALVSRCARPSTLAFVELAEGAEPQYAFYTEGTADSSLTASELPAGLPPDARCLLFGSISLTIEPLASAVEALARREAARTDSGAPVLSFDPNVRPVMVRDRGAFVRRTESFFALAHIVKISGADLDYLYPGLDREAALRKVLGFGADLVVTTLGKDGALAIGRKRDGTELRASSPVVEVEVADTIGAGDTFHGAFLARLHEKGAAGRRALEALTEEALLDALAFANAAASLVCSRRGAEPPTRAELDAFRARRA